MIRDDVLVETLNPALSLSHPDCSLFWECLWDYIIKSKSWDLFCCILRCLLFLGCVYFSYCVCFWFVFGPVFASMYQREWHCI